MTLTLSLVFGGTVFNSSFLEFAQLIVPYPKQDRIIQVGGLRIELDAHLPNDISDGEYVSFDMLRLDLD